MTDKDVLEKQVQDSIESLLDDLIKKGKPIYYWRSNAGKVFTMVPLLFLNLTKPVPCDELAHHCKPSAPLSIIFIL